MATWQAGNASPASAPINAELVETARRLPEMARMFSKRDHSGRVSRGSIYHNRHTGTASACLLAGLATFLALVFKRVAHDQRHLAESEQDGDRHRRPHLERHPEISREIAPDDLVQDREVEEDQTPAKGQFLPAFGIKAEGGVEDIAEQRLAEQKAAEQHPAEQRVDDGRLHLDEN